MRGEIKFVPDGVPRKIFNVLGILGIAGIVQPFQTPGIKWLDLWFMTGFSLLLLPILWSGFRIGRWEGGILLAGYGVYLWLLWPNP